jgi:RNA polymerase sigma-70 factor, ECF subfamily
LKPHTENSGMAGTLDFERMVEQHHAALYRFALSLSRNDADACDLVQETFLLWASKGHQLIDTKKAKAWLFTTLHREFLAGRRRLIRFPHHELSQVDPELPEVPPVLPSRVDWETLMACLGELDEVFRAPVALFYLEEYAYAEIAEILEVPLGTVKSRIARGVGQLQRMFVDRVDVADYIRPQPL